MYDFAAQAPRANCGRVSRLMLDGWEAYYRWLLELEKEAGREARARRATRR